MLNMNDIGFMLYMSEQEKKKDDKVNVDENSIFGVAVDDHNGKMKSFGKLSHNRGGESRCQKNNINEQ